MDVSHLFAEEPPGAPRAQESPDAIMDVEVVEEDEPPAPYPAPQAPPAPAPDADRMDISDLDLGASDLGSMDEGPEPPPPPPSAPAPLFSGGQAAAETFMVPQGSLEETEPAEADLGGASFEDSDAAEDLTDDLALGEAAAGDLETPDLGNLDHDSDALSVDGTEFADVDNLLDDLDDE
ncbi:MAG: hypothetical protein LBR53_06980 [Deltaproteobacteria bacterium]|jgi:hypothetical protein|nr:hypothetical protein [Deltaproteobacteria bacterium]